MDEVGNLSGETQGKLLRVLETRRGRKVGDTAEHDVDIRLIATTNRSLSEMVRVGAFRADLYYRLNVVPISLPPLRERSGDIPLLAAAFLEQFSRHMRLDVGGFAPETMHQMEIYPRPGNVRELRNIVERLAVLYGGTRIEFRHLPADLQPPTARDPQGIHGSIWEELTDQEYAAPGDKPLTLAAYDAGLTLRAYVEPVAVGDPLPDMPLFLEPGAHVLVPLEATYHRAFSVLPRRWSAVLERPAG